jgi:hypothetical protein
MGSLAEAVNKANLSLHAIQVNREAREVRYVPIGIAAAKKHGPNCRCEACSSLHMKQTRDKRMKAMMPGDVDMGNRQPAQMGKNKMKADMSKSNLPMPTTSTVPMKSKKFSEGQRKKLAKKHQAEPDGSFPIANTGDLNRAKHALGRSKNIAKTRKWINKRAKELGQPTLGH